MRLKAVIAYDGSAFFGFQRQKSTPLTVTQAIEDALKTLHIDTDIVGSGRTDRNVHATAQVIHFDVPDFWQDISRLKEVLNRKLTAIEIRHLYRVADDFHARFMAKRRYYRYLFKTRKPSVFEEKYIAYYQAAFTTVSLKKALRCFEGEHDFMLFHKTGSDVHTTVRTLYKADYYCHKDIHIISFEANGFLRAQVRLMVEAAMQCAQGKLSLSALQEQIQGEKRHISKPAPAEGLYLARIMYDA